MIRLATVFGDGMVLQRDLETRIWGQWSDSPPDLLELSGQNARLEVHSDGTWMGCWKGLTAGGPFELRSSDRVLATNVWVGDVWLCAGQSNMERSLAACEIWPPEAIRFRGDPGIRQLCLPNQFDFRDPRQEIPGARWIGADTDDVVRISAAAFHFASEMRTRYGVPQGIVLVAVGGSTAQAWLSRPGLEAFPRWANQAAQFGAEGWLEALQADERDKRDRWYRNLEALDPRDPGLAGVGLWGPSTPVPDVGSAWFRRRFQLDRTPTQDARLCLGTLVDSDETWVNGTPVGTTGYQYPTRAYRVPSTSLHEGTNTVLIRLVAPAGGLGFTEGKRRTLEISGASIDLSDGWERRPGASLYQLPNDTFLPSISLGLANGMQAPLAPMSLRAVLWYQGEANTGDPSDYRALMESLLAEWRTRFQRPDLPFLTVQLPLWSTLSDEVEPSGWAEVRNIQRQFAVGKGRGLVVTLDLGESNDLHPANKRDVGLRLALAARHVVFGEAVDPWTGPLVGAVRLRNSSVSIEFDQSGTGLAVRGPGPSPTFFGDGPGDSFHRLPARVEGSEVVLGPLEEPFPRRIRYGWATNPSGATLVNSSGLPASPFEVSLNED